jgi:DNA invertase Pin-like site-specific DNA recombinase
MKGKRIGYIRVSTVDQNEDRQLESVELDKKFVDKISGKSKDRPALTELLDYAREGDIVYVHSMDRLARNLKHLRYLVDSLTNSGVEVHFIKEGLIFTGDDNPMSRLLLNLMGAIAEFEHSLIKERVKEGVAVAKREGKYKGRKPSLSTDDIAEVKRLVEDGYYVSSVARKFKVSRKTIYKALA